MMISDSKSGVRRPSPTEWDDEVFEMVMDIFAAAEPIELVEAGLAVFEGVVVTAEKNIALLSDLDDQLAQHAIDNQ